MKIYQFALIWHPTEKQIKNGEKPKLIGEINTLLAKDDKQAQLVAARSIPKEYEEQLDQIEIAIRPF